MKPLQIAIELENNKLKSTQKISGGVKLVIDGETHFYKNTYLLPGFIDSHLHLFGIGENEVVPNFKDYKSVQDIVANLKQNPFFRDKWIFGYGWNEENFEEKKLPDKILLDKVFPNIPVCVKRVDGHSIWVNSVALQFAGINSHPTGILTDNAMEQVLKIIPHYSTSQNIQMILKAQEILFKYGITDVCDMDTDPELIDIYKSLDNEGQLKLRVHSYIRAQNDEYLRYITQPYFGRMFSIDGVKFFADGALGSRGAALFEPYCDAQNHNGEILMPGELLYSKMQVAIEHGFQIATHAIGDKANHLVLELYHNLLKKYNNKKIILRIEHCQMARPDDLVKFAHPQIFASVQPIHFISDTKGMAQSRIGERLQYAYPWRSFSSNGGTLLSGSDAPIESPDPILGLNALVNSDRPAETLDLESAIATYIANPHKLLNNYENNSEHIPFYNTNFVILNNDLSQNSFKGVCVIATISNGEIVYFDKN